MKPSRLIQGENERKQITISVRNLVEFLLRSGDIEEGQGMHDSLEAMQQGGKIHRKLQKKEGLSYHAEVPLKILISYEDYDLGLEGRADGIIYDEEDPESVVIDEIKGMYGDVTELAEPLEVHLAQAKCYAYIFGVPESSGPHWCPYDILQPGYRGNSAFSELLFCRGTGELVWGFAGSISSLG